MPVAPVVARKTWRTLEPIHGMVYFVPEGPEVYSSIGLEGARVGYFGSRAAAFGPVPAEVVIGAFYNFCPDLVRRCIPAAWEQATPADILAARLDVVDRSLTRLLGSEVIKSSEMSEAADLARRAADAIAGDVAGRPLYAAHASLGWPGPAHLVLWHAQTLLREYRGDGHIAALLLSDLDPVETLVTHAATGDVPADVLKATRAWPDEDWDAGVARLVGRGVVSTEGGTLHFTDEGRALRQDIEDATDMAAVKPYSALGDEGCARLRELGRPMSQAVVTSGGLSADPKRLLD